MSLATIIAENNKTIADAIASGLASKGTKPFPTDIEQLTAADAADLGNLILVDGLMCKMFLRGEEQEARATLLQTALKELISVAERKMKAEEAAGKKAAAAGIGNITLH